MALLELKNLNVGYADRVVIKNLSMTIGLGEFVSIIGPNGSGKTTLLKSILGLIKSTADKRSVTGIDFPKPQALQNKVGYVPQRIRIDNTIPVTVHEFLSLKNNFQQRRPLFLQLVKELSVEHLLGRSMHNLSVGEQQRVFLLFVLLSQPQLIFLDESFEGMDIKSQGSVYQYLAKLIQKKQCSVISISHDISAISEWSSRAVCLSPEFVFDGDPKSPEFHLCLHKIYGEKSVIHEHTH